MKSMSAVYTVIHILVNMNDILIVSQLNIQISQDSDNSLEVRWWHQQNYWNRSVLPVTVKMETAPFIILSVIITIIYNFTINW